MSVAHVLALAETDEDTETHALSEGDSDAERVARAVVLELEEAVDEDEERIVAEGVGKDLKAVPLVVAVELGESVTDGDPEALREPLGEADGDLVMPVLRDDDGLREGVWLVLLETVPHEEALTVSVTEFDAETHELALGETVGVVGADTVAVATVVGERVVELQLEGLRDEDALMLADVDPLCERVLEGEPVSDALPDVEPLRIGDVL